MTTRGPIGTGGSRATYGRSMPTLADALLRAQGKKDQAAAVQERFDKVWARADVKLSASRY